MSGNDFLSADLEWTTTQNEGRFVGFLNESERASILGAQDQDRDKVLNAVAGFSRQMFVEDSEKGPAPSPAKSFFGAVTVMQAQERAAGGATGNDGLYLAYACTPLDAMHNYTQGAVEDFSLRFRAKVESVAADADYAPRAIEVLRAVATAVERAALPLPPTLESVPSSGLSPVARPGKPPDLPSHGVGGDGLGYPGVAPIQLD